MMHRLLYFFIATACLAGCRQNKPFREIPVAGNPVFAPNTVFVGNENLSSPKFEALKQKYQLDTIFHGETDEFKRILLIRHWIRHIIPIDNIGPYPGDGSVESILDEAIRGHGFHCGHYSSVMNAVMNGYGYVTRCILADVGFPVDQTAGEGHHALNEIWVNKYHKWFLSDAKYDYHFEKYGIPLSALEVRDEYLRNQAKDIILVTGPDRIRKDTFPELKNRTTALFARIYTWLSWGKYGERYTNWPKTNTDYCVMYEDHYFKTHTWLYNGKPHWAYNTPYLTAVADRRLIEWTPNTVSPELKFENGTAQLRLRSTTPNLKSYQMRPEADTVWKNIPDSLELRLPLDSNIVLLRVINSADVAGPEYKMVIAR